MANGKKVKGGKKAIKDLDPKKDVRGGGPYLQYTLKDAYVSSYQL